MCFLNFKWHVRTKVRCRLKIPTQKWDLPYFSLLGIDNEWMSSAFFISNTCTFVVIIAYQWFLTYVCVRLCLTKKTNCLPEAKIINKKQQTTYIDWLLLTNLFCMHDQDHCTKWEERNVKYRQIVIEICGKSDNGTSRTCLCQNYALRSSLKDTIFMFWYFCFQFNVFLCLSIFTNSPIDRYPVTMH